MLYKVSKHLIYYKRWIWSQSCAVPTIGGRCIVVTSWVFCLFKMVRHTFSFSKYNVALTVVFNNDWGSIICSQLLEALFTSTYWRLPRFNASKNVNLRHVIMSVVLNCFLFGVYGYKG